jgi:hypothetical protein
MAKETTTTTADEKTRTDATKAKGPGPDMPPGDGPIEYRMKAGVHLAQAGSVVKEAWIGRVCGRSVRVYRGAPEAALPAEVRKAVQASGIEIGRITYEELGLAPPAPAVGVVNLTQQGLVPQG